MDYRETIKNDIMDWVTDNFEYIKERVGNNPDRETVREYLYEQL